MLQVGHVFISLERELLKIEPAIRCSYFYTKPLVFISIIMLKPLVFANKPLQLCFYLKIDLKLILFITSLF
jgi:hypothetical protein